MHQSSRHGHYHLSWHLALATLLQILSIACAANIGENGRREDVSTKEDISPPRSSGPELTIPPLVSLNRRGPDIQLIYPDTATLPFVCPSRTCYEAPKTRVTVSFNGDASWGEGAREQGRFGIMQPERGTRKTVAWLRNPTKADVGVYRMTIYDCLRRNGVLHPCYYEWELLWHGRRALQFPISLLTGDKLIRRIRAQHITGQNVTLVQRVNVPESLRHRVHYRIWNGTEDVTGSRRIHHLPDGGFVLLNMSIYDDGRWTVGAYTENRRSGSAFVILKVKGSPVFTVPFPKKVYTILSPASSSPSTSVTLRVVARANPAPILVCSITTPGSHTSVPLPSGNRRISKLDVEGTMTVSEDMWPQLNNSVVQCSAKRKARSKTVVTRTRIIVQTSLPPPPDSSTPSTSSPISTSTALPPTTASTAVPRPASSGTSRPLETQSATLSPGTATISRTASPQTILPSSRTATPTGSTSPGQILPPLTSQTTSPGVNVASPSVHQSTHPPSSSQPPVTSPTSRHPDFSNPRSSEEYTSSTSEPTTPSVTATKTEQTPTIESQLRSKNITPVFGISALLTRQLRNITPFSTGPDNPPPGPGAIVTVNGGESGDIPSALPWWSMLLIPVVSLALAVVVIYAWPGRPQATSDPRTKRSRRLRSSLSGDSTQDDTEDHDIVTPIDESGDQPAATEDSTAGEGYGETAPEQTMQGEGYGETAAEQSMQGQDYGETAAEQSMQGEGYGETAAEQSMQGEGYGETAAEQTMQREVADSSSNGTGEQGQAGADSLEGAFDSPEHQTTDGKTPDKEIGGEEGSDATSLREPDTLLVPSEENGKPCQTGPTVFSGTACSPTTASKENYSPTTAIRSPQTIFNAAADPEQEVTVAEEIGPLPVTEEADWSVAPVTEEAEDPKPIPDGRGRGHNIQEELRAAATPMGDHLLVAGRGDDFATQPCEKPHVSVEEEGRGPSPQQQ